MFTYPDTTGTIEVISICVTLDEATDLFAFASEIAPDSGAGRDLADELAPWIFRDDLKASCV